MVVLFVNILVKLAFLRTHAKIVMMVIIWIKISVSLVLRNVLHVLTVQNVKLAGMTTITHLQINVYLCYLVNHLV